MKCQRGFIKWVSQKIKKKKLSVYGTILNILQPIWTEEMILLRQKLKGENHNVFSYGYDIWKKQKNKKKNK